MLAVIKKKPWPIFICQAGLVLVVILALSAWVTSRFRIAADTQLERSLPDNLIYLVDLKDKELKRGSMYSLAPKAAFRFLGEDTPLVKVLVGLPGDTVEIDSRLSIKVNGETVGYGLPILEKFDLNESDFISAKPKILGNDEYWFMGVHKLSFDSRYWGAIDEQQILGRAYGII